MKLKAAILTFFFLLSFRAWPQEQITNSFVLNSFNNELDLLAKKRAGKVSIVHIGDSHVQGDYFSGFVRKEFQKHFGNAGRGFVFPYRLANSYGPSDVLFTSNGRFESKDLMHCNSRCDFGAVGFEVSTSENASLALRTDNTLFSTVQLHYDKNVYLPCSDSIPYTFTDTHNIARIEFDKLLSEIEFEGKPKTKSSAVIRGLVLENGQPGVLYHSLGVNGSAAFQYIKSYDFENQVKHLDPDLIILSFGTNDCYMTRDKFCQSCVKSNYLSLIGRLKNQNSDIPILLTTPPDHYYKRRYANSNLNRMCKVLYDVALETNVALYDLHSSMGGSGSVKNWHEEGLAAGDLIHYSKAGYQLQGEMLFNALLENYQQD